MGKFYGGACAALAVVLTVAVVAAAPGSAAPPEGPDSACTTSAGPSAPDPVKVMIAGDSISNASAGDYTWRYFLWKYQEAAGANIDLVGSFQDTIDANTLAAGNRQYLDCDFDQDHESRPGVKLVTERTDRFALGSANYRDNSVSPNYPGATSWIRGAVAASLPSIVVLFAGINDLARTQEEPSLQGLGETQIVARIIAGLKHVVAEARRGNPGVDMVLTTVPDGGGENRASKYNDQLFELAASASTSSERLVVASLPDWAQNSWDGVHPDAVGESRIAAAIADQLALLDSALAPGPDHLPVVALGPRVPAVLARPTVLGEGRIQLSWSLPAGADRTLVYSRNKSVGGPWVRRADLVLGSLRLQFPTVGTQVCSPANVVPQRPCTSFTLAGLSGGTEYEFRVVAAKGQAIASDLRSASVAAVAVGPVGRVEGLRVTAGVRSATLEWDPVGGVPGYDVQWRAAGARSPWSEVTSLRPGRTIAGLVAGRPYDFRVRAQGSASWSSEVRAVPRAGEIQAGQKPVLSVLPGTRFLVRWGASTGAQRYQVQRRTGGGPWRVVATTTGRSLTTARLVRGRSYAFRVRPFDGEVGGVVSTVSRRRAV